MNPATQIVFMLLLPLPLIIWCGNTSVSGIRGGRGGGG